MNSPWGRDGLMALCAMRYCIPRQSYIVWDCVEWMCENWSAFPDHIKKLMEKEIEEAFEHGAFGSAMDAQVWVKVRKLWNPAPIGSNEEESE